MQKLDEKTLQKSIRKSQHCQRNWDVSLEIPVEHVNALVTAVTECPSKQNIAFYRVKFVTNRDLIHKIHEATNGFIVDYEPLTVTTNSQVLANLLVVFEALEISKVSLNDPNRNMETRTLHLGDHQKQNSLETIRTDQLLSIGVASGYLNLTANLLGYSTGCCTCFEEPKVKNILNLEYSPVLLMGVGLPNQTLSRRIHHVNHDFIFPTKSKQKIELEFFK